MTRPDPAMGSSGYERIEADFYPTEAWCTRALLKNFWWLTAPVWEPACGEGHISKVLSEAGRSVYSTDLHDRGYGTPGQDFLKQTATPDGFFHIFTNPPYSVAEEFIRHAIKLTEPRKGAVAMLLRNEYDCAAGRVDLFRHPAFAAKLVLTKRPRWIAGSKGSPRHNYAWYVWDWSTHGHEPTIMWDQ